ncbi:trigger factor [Leptolyngbya sp. PCC 6406]|uniref:trigger factor n=1 Tax=Leptolyngbya sp. PCC 6406 TaxID=1173264 RepID=UPI0002ACC1B3|nr:trigger factor [Leptolyngbya sp. PCC 6406]
MKVIQETLPDSQVGLEIEIPGDLSQQTYEQVLRKLMKSVNVPGFRRGKVPRQVFLQRVGSTQVKVAALEELVQKAVDGAIAQEEIEAIGNYQLTSSFEDLLTQFQPGEPLMVKASVDVPPRITLSAYQGLTVQAEEVLYDPEQVDTVLEQYRTNRATLVPVDDRPAHMDDVAIIDFEGQIQTESGEFKPFEGGTASDFQLDLKLGGFIEGFVEGIVGMTLEETKEIQVTFPDAYADPSLAGKPAKFTITLKDLKEKELPDLDDEFAQDVSEFDSMAELRQSLEERYQEEAQDQTENNQREALLKVLVEQLQAEIPETIIRREVNYLVSQAAVQLSRQGIDVNKLLTPEIIENMRDRSRPEAVLRLQRTLALGEVAKQEAIAIDETALEARMAEMLAQVEDPHAVDQDRLREVVNEELLQETILDWLLEHNTVELVPAGTLTAAAGNALEAEETLEEKPLEAATATVEVISEEVVATAEESDPSDEEEAASDLA